MFSHLTDILSFFVPQENLGSAFQKEKFMKNCKKKRQNHMGGGTSYFLGSDFRLEVLKCKKCR